jgi:glycosyltransferase involved in cell wall biosynthesis
LKIIILSQFFDPEPTFKGLTFAKALRERGHLVTVITGFPNYPGGKVYPGYKMSLLRREDMDGVPVFRVPLFPSHSRSRIGRVLNYISFQFSATVACAFLSAKADLIYVYHPPPTVGLAAVFGRLWRRIPIVYDIQDLWPDTLKATGMISNDFIIGIIGKVCLWIYRRTAKIVVLSPGFRDRLIARGVPAEKIEIIYNWCDEKALAGFSPLSHVVSDDMEGRFNVVFAGNMGKAQGLRAVIDAALAIQSRGHDKILFTFVGGGIEIPDLRGYVEERGVKNVRFLPRMPMTEIGSVLRLADVLLVHLKDDPLFEITIPSKTQAYMAFGKPILMAVRGDAAELVKRAGCGFAVEPENPAELSGEIIRLSRMAVSELEAVGASGGSFYRRELSVEAGSQKFVKVFREVVESVGGL